MSYDEYMAAAVDDAVTIQAYVQAKQSYYAEQAPLPCTCRTRTGLTSPMTPPAPRRITTP